MTDDLAAIIAAHQRDLGNGVAVTAGEQQERFEMGSGMTERTGEEAMTETELQDLYKRATETYRASRNAAIAAGAEWWTDSNDIRTVVDLVLAERLHAQAPAPWDTLRAAAAVLMDQQMPAIARHCGIVANNLEYAEQEKAAAEKAREALIEKAARTMAAGHNPGYDWTAMGQYGRESFIAGARALADAGLLADPDVEGDQ